MFENVKYKIEYFLRGDWKFLTCICGVGATNQDYACVWCKYPREDRYNVTKTQTLIERHYGTRTCEEIAHHSRAKK